MTAAQVAESIAATHADRAVHLADEARRERRRHAARAVDVCPGCSLPAHASETDDAGYHPACAAVSL